MATTTTTQWSLDPSHTEIQFKVRHLMLSNVTGAFKSFTGAVTTEGDDFKTADIKFDAETASVDTSDTNRDNHLRSGEFFDAENHPHISFQSHGLKHVQGDHYKAEGTLTIRGVAKPVELDAEFNGFGIDPWGNRRAGFSLKGKVNRKDFGLVWNAPLEAGGFLLADDVTLLAEAQLIAQKDEVAA